MRILMINGSPREGGNTGRLLDLLSDGLTSQASAQRRAVQVETLALRGLRLCRGCRVCFDKGEQYCPLKDDVPMIYEKMLNADLIIMASPVYVDDVSGTMKTLIDRLAYLCHRPGLYGKGAYLLTSTGTTSSAHALGTMAMALRTWGVRVLGQDGIVAGALTEKGEIAARYGKKIAKTARRMLTSLATGKAEQPSLVSLLFFQIQRKSWLKQADASLDYRYWADKGWLRKGCDYYIPHRAGFLKRMTAKAVGSVIALFALK